jgi:hypothetical protein
VRTRTAILASLGALALTACGSSNSARSRNRVGSSAVAAIAPVSVGQVRALPRLSPGAPCPRTPGGHATHHAEIVTLGDGPVYPILGFAVAPPAVGGVIDFQGEGSGGRHPGGFWGSKVLFFVSPSYAGKITVEGKQLDGANPIDWLLENGQGGERVSKLELPAGGQWYPTEALLKGAGCYALRIQGSSFSRLIVFNAVTDRTFRVLTGERRNAERSWSSASIGHGISASYPRGWHLFEPPITSLSYPYDRMLLTSYPARTGGDCSPTRAERALPSNGVLVYLIEYSASPGAVLSGPPIGASFPAQSAGLTLKRRDLARYECWTVPGYMLRFSAAGRLFQAHIAFGARATATSRSQALAILSRLRVAGRR